MRIGVNGGKGNKTEGKGTQGRYREEVEQGSGLVILFVDAAAPQSSSPKETPRPLQPEVAIGSVVARLAVNQRVLCMAHSSAIKGRRLKGPK